MKKSVAIAFFLLGMLFLGAKAFVTLFAYQAIESAKQAIEKEFSLTYSWISSEYDGAVVFHDLVITPYRLKRTFSIERLEIHYDGYMGLFFGLPGLKSGSWAGIQNIVLDPFKFPLEGRNLEELMTIEYGDKLAAPFRLLACGDHPRITHVDLSAMGLTEVNGYLDLRIDMDAEPDTLDLSVVVDMSELGKILLETNWLAKNIPSHLSDFGIDDLKLSSLSLTHVEGGYFRRLSNYCSKLSGTNRENFSFSAAHHWKAALARAGVDVGAAVEGLYREYLLNGGQVKIAFKPDKPINLGDFESLLDQNLASRLNLEAKLNGEVVSNLDLRVIGEHFKTIEQVKIKTPSAPEKNINVVSPKVKRFLPASIDELDLFIGMQARLEVKNAKQFQGELVSIDEHTIEIEQRVGSGLIAYFLSRDDILQIEIER